MRLLKHMEESTVSSVARSCACVTVGETHVKYIRKYIYVKYIRKITPGGGWKAGDSVARTE